MSKTSRCILLSFACIATASQASGKQVHRAAPPAAEPRAPDKAGSFRIAGADAEKALASAVARYRAIVARGGWPRIAAGPWLRPGGEDPRLPRIRRRLTITGDLVVIGEPARKAYDFWTTRAVMRFQARHGLPVDGFVDRGTIAAMNVRAGTRLAQLERNLAKIQRHRNAGRQSCLFVHRPAFVSQWVAAGPSVWLTRLCDAGHGAKPGAGPARRRSGLFPVVGLHLSAWVAPDRTVNFRTQAASVPVQTFASPCGTRRRKCLNQKEH